ncbi:MAG: HNH endonuclease signature motif containing protein [Devosia sp.]|nr:HNH endonuclease signature motif containing protein [Devosia sp.]
MRGRSIEYGDDEMAWLEANRTMVISDYHRAFVATFNRPEISALNPHGLRKRKGWKTGREGDRYKGRHRRFGSEEIAWLEANYTLPITEYHSAFVTAFQREDVRPQNLHALRKRMGWKTGRTGCFVKGQAPLNKGIQCPPGTGGRHPNSQRTQFRIGALPHNTKGAGHERIDRKDGYIILIVDEPNPWTGAATRPVHKHRWLWEKLHGPIPIGMALKCLDGNRLNTDPSNWELVPRALLPRLNARFGRGYDEAPPELKPTILAVAKLEHRARELRKRS